MDVGGMGRAERGWCVHQAGRHGPGRNQRQRMVNAHKTRQGHGFTLIELMIVISMILILMSIAIPLYNQSILRAKESVLRQDLFTLRSVISQFTLDKQRAPLALEDLVQAGYLKQLPKDPSTGQPNWQVEQEDVLLAVDQQQPGISDVHSASNQIGSDGTAYSTW